MENHPIPQDITGFQFKLVGNMTVKQFVYLASGAILGWIFFISPLPVIIRLPLAVLFIAGGAIVAFVPVEGRPMDVMIGNFIKALLSPTKYVYSKEPPPLPPHSLPIEPKREDKAEKNAFQKVSVQKMTTTK
ncbi:MAG: PrgI family protein, partial [Candidatus Levybacteria bacterium]|nr:PrgI family protein [Candidatus Levybacteria bacterium]